MRNLKKFLALILAMMMTFSLMVTVNAATPTDFTDSDDITPTYAEAVNVLSALGVVKGDDGFRPGDPIKRSEVAAMLYRIAHNDAAEDQVGIYKDYNQFPDVYSDQWYAGAVNYCANAVLLKGYPDGKFHPNDNVTGYEVLVMTLRMLGYGQNGEFEGKQGDWRVQAAKYGRLAGLTKQIKEGTLGQPAKREVVAEIMFQALDADLVDYNLLYNYYPVKTLIPDDTANRGYYANAIAMGLVTLPRNTDLLYENYQIVGKSPTLTFDKFGRPSEMWVKDGDSTYEKSASANDSSMFIPNYIDGAANVGTKIEDAAGKLLSITAVMTPVAKYDNAVTECQVAKDINSDKTVAWDAIAEVLNGNAEAKFDGGASNGPKMGKTNTLALTTIGHDSGNMDALHTSDKWIGATGRITEIYDVSKYHVSDGSTDTEYVFVYVDNFLAEVKSITEAVKDPNGHEIKPATATVDIGTTKDITLNSAKTYKVGDLVLVQTPDYGVATAITDIAAVDPGEKVPVLPNDVHVVGATLFTADSKLVGKVDTKRVTINATKGVQDDKVGIITTDGETIYTSNTFLANKGNDGATPPALNVNTVLPEWYDVDDATKGITNSMIGRTFDLLLDQNGYIVGMKEVLDIQSNVGVITGMDSVRIGTGKYLTAVEAYMTDGSTKTFNVVNMTAAEVGKIGTSTAFDPSKFAFFKTSAAADAAWDPTTAASLYGGESGTGGALGIGSLVMFKQCTVEGVSAWYFADRSAHNAGKLLTDKTGTKVADNNMQGYELKAATDFVATGAAKCLDTSLNNLAANIAKQLDNKSVVFVAEPEYAYNTGSANEGNNSLKYNVYQGFKKMPTITAGVQASGSDKAKNNILYQQLLNNPEYVLVYPQNAGVEYIIKNQVTITVDESYLVLSRGATYAGYSEYNVLKNGTLTTLQVSNSNDTLNATIETAMAAGNLLTVTGRNAAGYVISANTVTALAKASNDVAIANCGGVNDNTDPNPLVKGTVTAAAAATKKFSENDGVINFLDGKGNENGLTLADNCTIQLVNLGTGAYKDISMGVATVYINKLGTLSNECDFTFELDQYGYVCSLYVIEK